MDEYELYNLSQDIGETKDLIQAEPAQAEAMKSRLKEFLKDAVPDGRR